LVTGGQLEKRKKLNLMTLLAFGYHPVISILNSPYFYFKKIVIQDKYQTDKKLLKLLGEKKIPYQLLNKEDFAKANFPKKNQGIVALLNDYEYIPFSDLLQIGSQKNFPLFVILDSIEDPHNFGAILRNSAAFEVDGIIIASKNQVAVTSAVIKVSMGGIAYVPVCQVNSLDETINELKKREYKIIATTCEENSTKYEQLLPLKEKYSLCLIFGNEHSGIRKSLIRKSDYSFYIPVNNNVPSLNVATSCGIVLALFASQK
jgi:23S rRNA (guanosine2251-2'-O)-methyltransferase